MTKSTTFERIGLIIWILLACIIVRVLEMTWGIR